MKHQITTEITDNEWKQTMVCKFASTIVAELVWDDTPDKRVSGATYISSRCNRRTLDRTELTRDGDTITATSRLRSRGASSYWKEDPDANKGHLEALAEDWEDKERRYLPIVRYFDLVEERRNKELQEWGRDVKRHLEETERRVGEIKTQMEAIEEEQAGCNERLQDFERRMRQLADEVNRVVQEGTKGANEGALTQLLSRLARS